ncbi:hypothetical protein G7Y89_g11945 [Cudoniella acicularis]|uniref:Uncharacterized protein n=1 Tax=Cudoniella acicularis TaxID=354080 RepID=A0A8H4RCI2_9HELO|nr:hypothetical protein G7Y89_g11945 [Cudoniella acicularis]
MQFSILTTILVLAASVQAHPASAVFAVEGEVQFLHPVSDAGKPGTSAAVEVTLCTGQDFAGTCYRYLTPIGYCSTFGAKEFKKMNDQASSIATDGDACTFFKDVNCQGDHIVSNLNYDLNDSPPGGTFNKVISSWLC